MWVFIEYPYVFVFYRKRADVKESRNSRIDNIVRLWGIEDRLIKSTENFNFTDNYIDYDTVSPRVEKLRNSSLDFLNKALS